MANSNILLIIAAFILALVAVYILYAIIMYQGNKISRGNELQLSTTSCYQIFRQSTLSHASQRIFSKSLFSRQKIQ